MYIVYTVYRYSIHAQNWLWFSSRSCADSPFSSFPSSSLMGSLCSSRARGDPGTCGLFLSLFLSPSCANRAGFLPSNDARAERRGTTIHVFNTQTYTAKERAATSVARTGKATKIGARRKRREQGATRLSSAVYGY